MPSDGLNGDCVVHYGSQHSGYTMRVKLLNGKREGAALIVNDGVPYINVVYERGVMTGNVESMNKNERIELKGRLINGVEDGLFVEYDENGRVMWRGYYKNGKMKRLVMEFNNDSIQ